MLSFLPFCVPGSKSYKHAIQPAIITNHTSKLAMTCADQPYYNHVTITASVQVCPKPTASASTAEQNLHSICVQKVMNTVNQMTFNADIILSEVYVCSQTVVSITPCCHLLEQPASMLLLWLDLWLHLHMTY